MYVVCTAGHVDHGKSTLVKALTGMEPDRFDEERRRGLTIDLGFAWTELGPADGVDEGPPVTVAFVDLPGHERFISNMLAGAGAVDLALFVVAADEGWMPQSQEHLEILDLLGVSRGLLAVTKADLVDPDTLAIGVELCREALAGTSFEGVDVVTVSGKTGGGLDRLRAGLLTVIRAAPEPPDRGRPRLWVDRSFTVRGAGTVVTGTLSGGWLRAGEDVAVLPGGRMGRIRGLQSLQRPVAEAAPGGRVAVNLSGVDRGSVRRGHAIGVPAQWIDVHAFDAWVRALPGHEIGRRGAWHLHAGSAERVARIRPLVREPVRGAAGGFTRVELDEPLALTAGDRFVLREAGRRATLGGGTVLDPAPERSPRGQAARQRRIEALERRRAVLDRGDRAALLELHLAERGASEAAVAAAAVGLTSEVAAQAAAQRGLVPLGTAWAHPDAVASWTEAVTTALGAYHAEHPIDRAAPKDVAARAATAAGCPRALAGPLLDVLADRGSVTLEGPGVRLPKHGVRLDPAQEKARDTLLALLSERPFAPPNLDDAAQQAAAPPALVRELEAAGRIVRLEANLAVTEEAVAAAHLRLARAYAQEGPLTAARAKEILDTSRKYALPLLGELDRRGLSRRRGDVRDVTPPD